METILTNAIEAREKIKDFDTVLKLLWLDAANLEDETKAEIALADLWATC